MSDSYGLITDQDVNIVARTLYGEFRGYKRQYYTMTAWVIRNRLESGRYGDSYARVVLSELQFSCWNTWDPSYDDVLYPKGKYWERAKEVARDVLCADAAENPIPEIFNYFTPKAMNPRDSTPSWAENMEKIYIPGIQPYTMTFLK